MKTAIVGGLALIVGLFAGNFASREIKNETDEGKRLESNMPMMMEDTVAAEDYVSMRPTIASYEKEELTENELQGLIYMREEEKLARDVYTTLYETWKKPIFSNIAQSEQTHTEAIKSLIDKYELPDPVLDDTVGVFVNPDLAQLYTDLVAKGKISLADAYTVGATIEDLDIRDLENELGKTDNADIKAVYENLQRGSRNHLRSFTKQLNASGKSYTPQYISETEYQTILSNSQETGGGMMRGWGGGMMGR